MTREQILDVCRRAPAVGAVKHEDFADYVVALQQRKKVDDVWTNVEHPYMTVDGKLAMANEDHRRQAKRLDFDPPIVLIDSDEQLTLMVNVTSELYGTRHGIATSRRIGGTAAEREFPWEVAETSAIGRALTTMGYGLFPGSGLASAEDMLRSSAVRDFSKTNTYGKPEDESAPAAHQGVTVERAAQAPASPRDGQAAVRHHTPLSPVQRRKLVELYRSIHGGSEMDANEGLEKLFGESFKHGMNEATYEEGARMTAQLLAEQRAR